MASNSFGNVFRMTTWGESHGKAIGVVIDGCPAGLALSEEDINAALALRAPGQNAYTSPRKENDIAEIYSGVFEGVTTGAPISIIIHNQHHETQVYAPVKDLLKPGHANFTYLEKYGVFDWRGGGRASARETACRVAAGAVAKKLLAQSGIKTLAYLHRVGDSISEIFSLTFDDIQMRVLSSPIFCPDVQAQNLMMKKIDEAKTEGDSLGGVVAFMAVGLPAGLGDPVYEKLEANLAKAMLSIPASKGFEIGEGFEAARMQGSTHNDLFVLQSEKVVTQTNRAGGILGGISTGMPLVGRVAFKPTSSIKKPQATLDTNKQAAEFVLPEGSRHDPCVAIRAVWVVDAMCALVLADTLLMNRASRV